MSEKSIEESEEEYKGLLKTRIREATNAKSRLEPDEGRHSSNLSDNSRMETFMENYLAKMERQKKPITGKSYPEILESLMNR